VLPYYTKALDALEHTAIAKSRSETLMPQRQFCARLWRAAQRSFHDVRNLNI
jgi:hypothetical protein